jgi:hypothetical protein
MITTGALAGFKSWKRIASMRFAPLTGLFGTNSSGKTSILQWLLLLKQTAESSDRLQVLNLGDQRDLVELGTFQDIVHGHTQPGRLSWDMSWTLPEPLRVEDPEAQPGSVLFQDDKLSFSGEIHGEQGGRIKVSRMTYTFAGIRFHYRETGARGEYELTAEGGKDFHFVRPRGRPWPLAAPVKC